MAASGRKFNPLDKKEENKFAKKFKIMLAGNPNLQQTAERSRKNSHNEQKQ